MCVTHCAVATSDKLEIQMKLKSIGTTVGKWLHIGQGELVINSSQLKTPTIVFAK